MADDPPNNTPRRPLRALYEWIAAKTSAPSSASGRGAPVIEGLPTRIGHYVITRKLGHGGMGVVYAARDDRLERPVALKLMSTPAGDGTARRRFWREARAAASVNHPNICQIYEIGEDAGTLFIAMELLEGEALSDGMQRGPLSASDTVALGLDILKALSALHARGIVHRDLKPSNVFITTHGVKLLDFGLARPQADASLITATGLTGTGMVLGTPRYMAPEQVNGEPVDARTDLFALGAILFEMVAGRPAFEGRTVIQVLHATLHEQPPALVGPPAFVELDRVVRQALAKDPARRPASADGMADRLRAIRLADGDAARAMAQPLTRLVVLPFRVLRPDPESDFLSFSLPDAIATSLAGIGSLVVRSSAAAARFATESPDLKSLAAEADVDRVVMGTLLRAGDQVRATAQLVEAPGGTLITSHTVQSSLGDLFRLQDDIAGRVAEALSLPLSGSTALRALDVPADAPGYELYLRANELGRTYDGLVRARDLYRRYLERDPAFAPAWAHLGRCHRVIGKYIEPSADSEDRAQDALRRALELSPRLTVAHKFLAQLEADTGRAESAVVRLLREASRHGNDPELFAGLVHACRYVGLYNESVSAHAEARRLDPHVPTSVDQTLLMTGDIDRLLASDLPLVVAGADDGTRVIGLALAGRRDEARNALIQMREAPHIPVFRVWTDHLLAWLDRRAGDLHAGLSAFRALKIQDDPEAIFQEGWFFADLGEGEVALEFLARAVAKGYFAATTLARAPQFDFLRGDSDFLRLCAQAEAGRQQALTAFREAGGHQLLGGAPVSAVA